MRLSAMRPGPLARRHFPALRHLFRSCLIFVAIGHAICAAPAALAQGKEAYPSKPLRFIVPFAPGGAADVIGRSFSEQLQREIGQPVVVVNRDGAGTIVGVNYVANSAPDGYTLLQSGDAGAINTASGRALPYDFLRDLQPISILFSGAQVVLVNKTSRFNTLADLIKEAKARPGMLKYGSSGIGTSVHLSLEAFNAAAGIQGLHVPYRGVSPAITDLMGGQLDYVMAGSSIALPAIQNGSLKALAIASDKRSSFMPDIPTAKEQGVDVETTGWYGLFVRAGTPPDIVAKLNAAAQAALRSPELSERFKSIGGEARGTTPEQASQFVKAEILKFTTLMRKLDIKLEN